MTDTSPCSVCGAPVRIRREQQPDQPKSDEGPRYESIRVCTNRNCPTKMRDQPLGMTV